ncbi:MerC domain-containing protein [Novipirellula caenicola]|uniref:MerC mercury resistance protein n=1 Tax=Novipirellula caenicola TaxID=1536901 RepID=A0ABP9VLF8_9BACT
MIELTTGNPAPVTDVSSSPSRWRDWIGVVASVGCAIHCAAMPFVIGYLPLLGLSFLADEAFHRWMALACFLIAIAAFIPGFRTHKRLLPGAIAVIGLVLISGAAFGMTGDCCAACESGGNLTVVGSSVVCTEACCEHCTTGLATLPPTNLVDVTASETQLSSLLPLDAFGSWITPIGGLLLVTAHLLNRRYGCLCGCCENGSDGSEFS